ncbi:MAG: hypothetical protein Q9177_001203 [Variospora cf. flavescens]
MDKRDEFVTNGTATTERLDAVSNFSVSDSIDNFTFSSGTLHLYQSYFRNIFQGEAWRGGGIPTLYVSSDATQALFQPFNIFGQKADGKDVTSNQGGGMDQLQKILDNIAVAMTNV